MSVRKGIAPTTLAGALTRLRDFTQPLFILALGVSSMSATAANSDRLTKLHPPPAATTELDAQHHADECHKLESTVLAYLKDKWHVDGTRCFLLQDGANWNSMEKFVDSELPRDKKERVRFEWHDPGHDLVAVWKVGSEYVATAMSKEPVAGQPLVGYFALSKE
jgi:hypothetical protein